VGFYVDGAGAIHGYLWEKGRVTRIDAPGAPITLASGINDLGQIVGTTLTENSPTGVRHGFLLSKGVRGGFTPIDFPGAPQTQVGGINDRGQIVGRYLNPAITPGTQPTGMRLLTGMP
jgi:probable HAF family extracellular repeat protein